MEGSQFSTKAESNLYRQWGCDVIGMTNMPEAKLAREAEMCYASVAMVTDYDCWHPDHDAVTVEQVVKVLLANADRARALVKAIVPRPAAERAQGCHTALEHAIITIATRSIPPSPPSWTPSPTACSRDGSRAEPLGVGPWAAARSDKVMSSRRRLFAAPLANAGTGHPSVRSAGVRPVQPARPRHDGPNNGRRGRRPDR